MLKKVKKSLILKEEKKIEQIIKTFHQNNFECFLIGGSVRDLLLNMDVYDYDFATNARPEEILPLFKKVIPTGIKHGTVSVLLEGTSFEVTTYRADGKYLDGRRPESISFSKTLEEDVKRRDFTINGLAYDLVNKEIIDYVQGIEDLDKKIIKTIGNPLERFSEDGLRCYRACRLAAKLNFKIEEQTSSSISQTIPIAKKVAIERIRDEFKKTLEAETPSLGIEALRKFGLLKTFLPELASCYQVFQNKYHLYDVYYHSLYSCDAAPANFWYLRLAALFHDIGKPITKHSKKEGENTFYNHEVVGAKITRRIMRRLKFSNEEISKVNNLVINHMFHYTDDWTDGAVRRFIKKVGLENINDLFLLRLADRKGNGSREGFPLPIKRLQERIKKIIAEENALSVRDLKIDGTLIMNHFGLKPGRIIGEVLKFLLDLVLDNPELNKEQVLLEKSQDFLKSYLPSELN